MKNKNIILLVFDSLRADKLSCLGYNKRDTTPFFNSIIDKCSVFNKHYTCAVRSLSAHISLVTGVHPHIHKACDDWSAYLEDFPTIFQIAQNKGYYTFGISTDNPFLRRETGFIRGFDKYIQIVKSNKQISNEPFLLKKIDEKLNKNKFYGKFKKLHRILFPESKNKKDNRQMSEFYLKNDLGAAKTFNLLREELEKLNFLKKNYFVFANTLNVHRPFLPLKEYREIFGKVNITDNILRANFDQKKLSAGDFFLTEPEYNDLHKLYDCQVRYMDDNLKSIFEYIDVKFGLENFIIIITSDHGEMLLEKDNILGHVGNLYEQNISIPLIIYDSDSQFKGKKINTLTSIVDVFPTLLKQFELEIPEYITGCDLFEKSVKNDENNFVIAEHPDFPFPEFFADNPSFLRLYDNKERMIYDGKYKLIWNSRGNHKLYDKINDFEENKNIFSKENAGIFNLYLNKMTEWYNKTNDKALPNEFFEINKMDYTAYQYGIPENEFNNRLMPKVDDKNIISKIEDEIR